MSQIKQPDKKIVSKGKYAQVQSVRLGVGLAGMGMLFAAVLCLLMTIGCFMMALGTLIMSLFNWTWESWSLVLVSIAVTLLMGVGTRILWKSGTSALDKTDTMNNVVPFTKTTISDVPVQDSLVRASEEPPVAPETILLRAAADNTTTPPEQLVRPSTSPD